MATTYVLVGFIIGLFMSFAFNSETFVNLVIKVAFICWTVWSGVMLIAQLAPNIGAMRLI